MQKPVEKPIKFVKNLLTKGKSYPITHTEAVIDNNGNTLSLILDNGISGGGMTKTTWQELKDKRDAGELTPGSLYRITDYNCTTTQENTKSAGHQFDIVLLALSENKLAEEGWAMMNESNIYDVAFSDGVTKKCWIYCYATDDDISFYNVVLVDTLLGLSSVESGDIIINEENKTAIFEGSDSNLSTEGLMYNYFQNSNLSAWKVWYCLDNDKSRFAWADDSMDKNVVARITTTTAGIDQPFEYIGTEVVDGVTYYRWWLVEIVATLSPTPSVGDDLYQNRGHGWELYDSKVLSFTPSHEGKFVPSEISVETPVIDEGGAETNVYKRNPSGDREKNGTKYYQWKYASFIYFTTKEVPSVGDPLYKRQSSNYVIDDEASLVSFTPGVDAEKGRGVIYRLIDEFNNDVAYDFKNIQFIRKLTDGELDTNNGTDTWVYTFNAYDVQESAIKEASVLNGYTILEEFICEVRDNYICNIRDDFTPALKLSNNCFLGIISKDAEINVSFIGIKFVNGCFNNTIPNTNGECICIRVFNKISIGNDNIWLLNKKVLTES